MKTELVPGLRPGRPPRGFGMDAGSIMAALSALLALIGALGCVSRRPPIQMLPGAEQVKVIRPADQAPLSCHDLGLLTESDGQTDGPGHYAGTDDRLEMKLRNRAVGVGANAIAMLDFRDPTKGNMSGEEVVMDCGKGCGQVLWQTARAYACPKARPTTD